MHRRPAGERRGPGRPCRLPRKAAAGVYAQAGAEELKKIRRLLIANRGEIAVRIIRACREMAISPVAVYSDADRDSLHVSLADSAYPIGPAPAAESYLCAEAILKEAKESRSDAIHPGYGFLSEDAAFA